MTEKREAKGLWKSCCKMEIAAALKLGETLKPFEESIEDCYECGVEVPTLKSKYQRTKHLSVAAILLKRALTDLRAIWSLIQMGYTSQAGCIAAATFEDCLVVDCVSLDKKKANQLLKSDTGDSPWSVVELCKFKASEYRNEAIQKQEQFTGKDFNTSWMNLYAAYKWLCKIKHPTMPSTTHDVGSSAVRVHEFVVMATPDIREEDLPTKYMVLIITIMRVQSAISAFASGAELDASDERVIRWKEKCDLVVPKLESAITILDSHKHKLPFHINDKVFAKKLWDAMNAK